jgi:tryptophan synthase beta chain
VEFTTASDREALDALKTFARNEGVIFALESAHGAAEALRQAKRLPKEKAVIVNMSGRGDKDIFITAKALSPQPWREFLLSEAATIGGHAVEPGSAGDDNRNGGEG